MIDQIRSTIVFRTAVLTVVLFVMNFLAGLVFGISDSAQSETTLVWFGGIFLVGFFK